MGTDRTPSRDRRALRQHDPDAVDRRDPEGELRSSGDADGARAGRLHALAAVPALRSRRPDLAQPRPLRALQRPRLDAALLAAPPDRRAGPSTPTTRSRAGSRSPSTTSRRFRQLDSKAAGHPEYRWTSGVETTTGPLGQGIATSVGMAIAGKWLAAHFNRPGFELFDYDVYAIAGDGCLMEGVSHEAGIVRRPPAARQPLLDLRQQPHHDRRRHRDHLRRRRRSALHGLRLERDPGRRRQRPRADRARVRDLPRDRRPPDADHRRQPHRLRIAAQAGHRRRPRRAARRGGGRGRRSASTAGPRTPSSWSPTAFASTSPPGSGHAGASCAASGSTSSSAIEREHETLERQIDADAAPRAARGLGPRHPELRRRRRRGSRRARPRTRSRTRSPSRCPGI